MIRSALLLGLAAGFCLPAVSQTLELGRLAQGEKVLAVESASGWTLAVEAEGKIFATLGNPVSLEFYQDGWPAPPLQSAYQMFTPVAGGHSGKATVNSARWNSSWTTPGESRDTRSPFREAFP